MFGIFEGNTSTVAPATSNMIGPNDYGTGDDHNQDFTLTENAFDDLGNLAQSGDATFFSKLLSTLTSSGPTNAHTSTAPVLNDGVIFPNKKAGLLRAYDQIYSQVAHKIYAIGDIDDVDGIWDKQYTAAPGDPGIKVYFTNRITQVSVAIPDWLQFAPLNAADMSIGAYGDPGDPLFLSNDILGVSTLNGQANPPGTSITLHDVTDFFAGQFVKIGTGANAEICWITQIVGSVLSLLAPLANTHLNNTAVAACCGGFAIQVSIPNLISGGIPKDWFNCSLDSDYQYLVRV